jgi:hypothetical protein
MTTTDALPPPAGPPVPHPVHGFCSPELDRAAKDVIERVDYLLTRLEDIQREVAADVWGSGGTADAHRLAAIAGVVTATETRLGPQYIGDLARRLRDGKPSERRGGAADGRAPGPALHPRWRPAFKFADGELEISGH